MKKIIFLRLFFVVFSLFLSMVSLFAGVSELAFALEQIKLPKFFEAKEPQVKFEETKHKLKPEKPKKRSAILKIVPKTVEEKFIQLDKLLLELEEELGELAAWRKLPIVKPKTELEIWFKKLISDPVLFEQQKFKETIKKIYFGDLEDRTKPSIWKMKMELRDVSSKEREYRVVMAEIAAILNPDLKKSVKEYKKAMKEL